MPKNDLDKEKIHNKIVLKNERLICPAYRTNIRKHKKVADAVLKLSSKLLERCVLFCRNHYWIEAMIY
jgi:hypothetical protein